MASGPITSWEKGKVETVKFHIFWLQNQCSDSSQEIKRHLLLGRKAVTTLDSALKSRDIILLTKVCIVKATVFPVVMYGVRVGPYIKKTKCRRIDAFKLWCWRRLLESLGLQGDQISQS